MLTWAEQGGRHDADAVCPTVGLGAGGDDNGIEEVVADVLSEPVQVPDVAFADLIAASLQKRQHDGRAVRR